MTRWMCGGVVALLWSGAAIGGEVAADYVLDDGTLEGAAAVDLGEHYLLLNPFEVLERRDRAVLITFPDLAPDVLIRSMSVYADPNGDGLPDDAELLFELAVPEVLFEEALVELEGGLIGYRVPAIDLGDQGDAFFLAVEVDVNDTDVLAFDASGGAGANGLIAPFKGGAPDLGAAQTIAGVWAIRGVAADYSYQLDDCDAEANLYYTMDGSFEAINLTSYQVEAGSEVLTMIEIGWGGLAGQGGIAAVWADPTDDGDPTDAVPVWSQAFEADPDAGFYTFDVGGLDLGDAGEWFYVGLAMDVEGGLAGTQVPADSQAFRPDRFFVVVADEVDVSDLSGAEALPAGAQEFGFIARAAAAPACPGDLDADGSISSGDLNLVLGAFGQLGLEAWTGGDATGDGAVDSADLNAVLGAFASVCE